LKSKSKSCVKKDFKAKKLLLAKTFSLLCGAVLNKGQVLTDYYRLMNRHGGYVWLQTCATIICNAKNVDEQNIIAINYVLR